MNVSSASAGSAMSIAEGPLDSEAISRYHREGWLSVPQALSPSDVEILRRCCLAAEERGIGGMIGESKAPKELAETFAYQTQEHYRRMFQNDHNLRLAFPELRSVVAKLGTIARQLLRRPDIRVMWDKTFNKPPVSEGSRATVWHQDIPYVPIDRRGFMSFWTPLEAVDDEGGAMRYVPRSHRLGSLGRIPLSNDSIPDLSELLSPEDFESIGETVVVPLQPGDTVVHDGLTIHGAGPNQTDHVRRAWSCVFIPGDSLWTGGPFPHANFYDYGLKTFQPFDHPDLRVD